MPNINSMPAPNTSMKGVFIHIFFLSSPAEFNSGNCGDPEQAKNLAGGRALRLIQIWLISALYPEIVGISSSPIFVGAPPERSYLTP